MAVTFFNGSSGSLGQYFSSAFSSAKLVGIPIKARLGDTQTLQHELEQHQSSFTSGDCVSFLQAAAKVPILTCEKDPVGAYETNVIATVATVRAFCQWAKNRQLTARITYVSSGHVYEYTRPGSHLTEEHPVAPRSVYAKTKLAAELALQELVTEGLCELWVARVFGLIAPRQPAAYVLPGLIARVRENRLSEIPGLDSTRDYLDARDVSRVLIELSGRAPAEKSQILNVCSGVPVTIRQIVVSILSILDPQNSNERMRLLSPGASRPGDVDWIVGDATRLESILKEAAQRISLLETLREASLDTI